MAFVCVGLWKNVISYMYIQVHTVVIGICVGQTLLEVWENDVKNVRIRNLYTGDFQFKSHFIAFIIILFLL